MVDVAEVKIWGEVIGAVRWDETVQMASFEYDPKFLAKGIDLSPIKMPIQNGPRIYSFPELRKSKDEESSTFQGLPGLLADALPDKYGNQLINLWLAQNGRAAGSMNPVEQLCFIGTRGMGALEFEPATPKSNNKSFSIEVESLVEGAKKLLSNRSGFETKLSPDEKTAMTEILKVGTSAGGMRPKAVIAYNSKTKEVRSGQVKAPKGFEHWLLKLDGVSDAQFGESHGFGRVEYAYHLMAKACNIDMMECRLLEENERAHFMTKRFDRAGNAQKHHVQTFCGIQHYDYTNLFSFSYEQLFQTMRSLRLTYPEAEQMFRRMTFNVLATNYDDHTKNFAFLLKENGKWTLAPAYDVCHAYSPDSVWVNQHTLSINGKHRDITQADLLTIAKANNIKKAERLISEIRDVVLEWENFADEVGVQNRLKASIWATLHARNFGKN